jgi:hypothetical protein
VEPFWDFGVTSVTNEVCPQRQERNTFGAGTAIAPTFEPFYSPLPKTLVPQNKNIEFLEIFNKINIVCFNGYYQ